MTADTYCDFLISDLHKDVYGYRPSESFYSRWKAYTDHEKQGVWDSLCAALEEELAFEETVKARAKELMEARIEELMEIGAQDREQAIRWIMQAEQITGEYGYEELEYHLGLPYGYVAGTL
jgi:hypothetical protein